MWTIAMKKRERPELVHASEWIIAAIVIHALYNTAVIF